MFKPKNAASPISLPTLAATKKLAQKLAKTAQAGDVFGLIGELGAGKTTFTQFFAAALGVKSRVTSPTFTLVQSHKGSQFILCHIDAYRTATITELGMAGLDDALADPSTITVIEWADRVATGLPPHTIWLHFIRRGTKRTVHITKR